jgi:hypothetical protein
MTLKEFIIFVISWMTLVIIVNWLVQDWDRNAWESIASNLVMLGAVGVGVLAYRAFKSRRRVPPN